MLSSITNLKINFCWCKLLRMIRNRIQSVLCKVRSIKKLDRIAILVGGGKGPVHKKLDPSFSLKNYLF
jgi:hypothetical protein